MIDSLENQKGKETNILKRKWKLSEPLDPVAVWRSSLGEALCQQRQVHVEDRAEGLEDRCAGAIHHTRLSPYFFFVGSNQTQGSVGYIYLNDLMIKQNPSSGDC